MSTNNRREIWDQECFSNPEEIRKVIEAFYLLFGNKILKKHFTEESDEERLKVLAAWSPLGESGFSTCGGSLTDAEELELNRLDLESSVLERYGFEPGSGV